MLNQLHSPQIMPATAPGANPALEPQIEDYLDHVCAPLVGRVSYSRRQALRAELVEHLEALIEAREELGESRDVAVRRALRQFGEPEQIAHQWLQEWAKAEPATETMWEAARRGILYFAPAAVLGWVLMGELSHRSATGTELFTLVFAVPILLGCILGLRVQRWRLLAGCAGPAAVAFVSALIALTLFEDGANGFANLTGAAFIAWLPMSSVAAEVTGWVRRRMAPRAKPWRFQQV